MSSQKNKLLSDINELSYKSLLKSYPSQNEDFDDEATSSEVKNKLAILKNDKKKLISNLGVAISSRFDKKKEQNSIKKLILVPYESETVNLIKNVTVSNVDRQRDKIIKVYDKLNKTFEGTAQISKELLEITLQELELQYSYIVKKVNEKEQQKAIKEQMIEEAKAQREIENEQKSIDKEIKKFSNERDKLTKYIEKTNDEVQQDLYKDRIKELEAEIFKLNEDKKHVDERAEKTRSGYVYVISNIGSFGENVYKIGMTKRLEPMDRIKELSSASVPFEFDVHAMIFSDDAPHLENLLHKRFYKNSLNKINFRKEFFKVPLSEIKEVVENEFDSTVEFTEVAKAEEYRQSVKLA